MTELCRELLVRAVMVGLAVVEGTETRWEAGLLEATWSCLAFGFRQDVPAVV